MITLTAGTAFIMWLGEQITEKGIGNGISLIIFAGIVARLPNAVGSTLRLVDAGTLNWFLVILLIALVFFVVGFVVFMETSQRRIPVQYAKRIVGRKMLRRTDDASAPQGTIPQELSHRYSRRSIIMFPATIANFAPWEPVKKFAQMLTSGSLLHEVVYVGFIIFFCYFYTAIVFNPDNVADNMKKYGGYIPGIRPGKKQRNMLTRY